MNVVFSIMQTPTACVTCASLCNSRFWFHSPWKEQRASDNDHICCLSCHSPYVLLQVIPDSTVEADANLKEGVIRVWIEIWYVFADENRNA